MNYSTSYSETHRAKVDKVMEADQFAQVVEAILAGKYSWACVLILRFAGYNPLHYIPYRTYNRLVKDNMLSRSSSQEDKPQKQTSVAAGRKSFSSANQNSPLYPIRDLAYVEAAQEKQQVKGGYCFTWLNGWFAG
ncbi:HetP family heterocyst commitment protein [Cyanobacteria bacterium FACHB-63]|nr:HetP family heterocyst commitment protein [Cyanobacteria bacterium FACHB-63]